MLENLFAWIKTLPVRFGISKHIRVASTTELLLVNHLFIHMASKRFNLIQNGMDYDFDDMEWVRGMCGITSDTLFIMAHMVKCYEEDYRAVVEAHVQHHDNQEATDNAE